MISLLSVYVWMLRAALSYWHYNTANFLGFHTDWNGWSEADVSQQRRQKDPGPGHNTRLRALNPRVGS